MKKIFRKLHVYSALFFLPMALLFSVTGILSVCGINQDYGAKKKEYQIIQNQKDLRETVLDFLNTNHIKIPHNTELKKGKGALMMGSTSYSVMIKSQGNQVAITTVERSFIGNMIMLHKAKAGKAFVVFNGIFGVALLFFYLSGLILLIKKYHKWGLFYFVIGLLVSVITAVVSL